MSHSKKQTMLFDPDAITSSVAEVLKRDFGDQQKYDLNSKLLPLQLFAYRQVNEFTKKYKSAEDSSKTNLSRTAMDSFIATNDRIGNFNGQRVFPSQRRLSRDISYFDRTLIRARHFIHDLLGTLDTEKLFYACKHSGGTTFGLTYAKTSLFDKSQFPLTYTGGVNRLFDIYLQWDPQYAEAIASINFEAQCKAYQWVDGSRTTTVDKDDTKDRTICIEPTLNMFFQQGLMSLLYAKLKLVGLDLSNVPQRHHRLAFLSSVSKQYATIDFSSASDSVSTALIKYLFPPDWFACLDMVRSKRTLIDGNWVELNIFSSMGNATTFPIETLVFTALLLAVSREDNLSILYPDDVRLDKEWGSVFGDDCIVKKEYAHTFISVCNYCGFIVNEDKSYYNDEPFRETCGHDYYDGRNIRPFYIKAPVNLRHSSKAPWLYSIINILLKKYKMCFGERNYLYEAESIINLVLKLISQDKTLIRLIPDYFPDDAGLKINDIRFLDKLLKLHAQGVIRLDELADNRHGTIVFKYHKFEYKKRPSHELLDYWGFLNKTVHRGTVDIFTREDDSVGYTVKRKGGYVVAQAEFAWMSKEMICLFYK